MIAAKQSVGRLVLYGQKSFGSSWQSLSPSSSISSQASIATPMPQPCTGLLNQKGSFSTYTTHHTFERTTKELEPCSLAGKGWSGFDSKLWPELERLVLDSSGRSSNWVQVLLVVVLTFRLDNIWENLTQMIKGYIYRLPRLRNFGLFQTFDPSPVYESPPPSFLLEADWRVESGEFESRQVLSPATVKPVEAEEQSDEWGYGHFVHFAEEQTCGFLGPAFTVERLDTLDEEIEEECQDEPLTW